MNAIGHCLGCNEPILGKATSFTRDNLKYNFHSKCFTCGNCLESMEGKTFYQHQGIYLDKDCYHKVILGSCYACNVSFQDPTVVKAGGRLYHRIIYRLLTPAACFLCSDCKEPLTSSYIEKDSKFLCKVILDLM